MFMIKRVKELMAIHGLSAAVLAEKIGISAVAMSNILTGKNNPSLDKAIKIAEVLGVTVSYLIGETSANEIVCPRCGKKIVINLN